MIDLEEDEKERLLKIEVDKCIKTIVARFMLPINGEIPINKPMIICNSVSEITFEEYLDWYIKEAHPFLDFLMDSNPEDKTLEYKIFKAEPIRISEYFVCINAPGEIIECWMDSALPTKRSNFQTRKEMKPRLYELCLAMQRAINKFAITDYGYKVINQEELKEIVISLKNIPKSIKNNIGVPDERKQDVKKIPNIADTLMDDLPKGHNYMFFLKELFENAEEFNILIEKFEKSEI